MGERQKNINKFQDPNSPVRFFIGTTQTGGYGITLTAALLWCIILMVMILRRDNNQKLE